MPVNPLGSFNFGDDGVLLESRNLLVEFRLKNADSQINFEDISADLYKIDLDEIKKDEHVPNFMKIDNPDIKRALIAYILNSPKESQVRELTGRMMQLIGNMYPIPDQEIREYLKRIISDFNTQQMIDFVNREYSYIDKIKGKIKWLASEHAEKQFEIYLDTDKIITKEHYQLPEKIAPGKTAASITKSLYEKEGAINDFEQRVINDIANLETTLFWHRNQERKGFCLNGFINHYSDFIVVTKSGKIVIIETKGDMLDNLDSLRKIKLGRAWANKAGTNYKYFMVFDKKQVEGAYTVDEIKNLLKEI